MSPSLLLMRSAALEARRGGLPWLMLGLIAVALGLAAFVSQVAVTESRELQAALAAALLRGGAAFLLAAHVAASVVREANDKVLELALALPLSRHRFWLGKLGGYAAVGFVMALACALPMLLWAGPAQVAAWGVSLGLELALVAAASLFFAGTLASVVPAIAATAGLYLLARSVAAIQLLARGPLTEESLAQVIARGAVDAIALVLPRLDLATRSEWLLYGVPSAAELATAAGALAVYTVLLAAAGMFDFQRRNL